MLAFMLIAAALAYIPLASWAAFLVIRDFSCGVQDRWTWIIPGAIVGVATAIFGVLIGAGVLARWLEW